MIEIGDHVHELETAGEASRRHVADRHHNCVGTWFGVELLHHVRRKLNPVNPDAT